MMTSGVKLLCNLHTAKTARLQRNRMYCGFLEESYVNFLYDKANRTLLNQPQRAEIREIDSAAIIRGGP